MEYDWVFLQLQPSHDGRHAATADFPRWREDGRASTRGAEITARDIGPGPAVRLGPRIPVRKAQVPFSLRIRRERGSAVTLTAARAEFMERMEALEGGRRVPSFARCQFAGIRPLVPAWEIIRPKPEDVNLETGLISVSAEVSKVREPRKVEIHPNLAA